MLLRRMSMTLALFLVVCVQPLLGIGAYCSEEVWVGIGYRYDHFYWSVGDDPFPNILSELEWQDIGILECSILGWKSLPNGFYMRYGASYGSVVSGDVRDEDYALDDRQHRFSLAKSRANRGNTFDAQGGLGWQFGFFENSFLFAIVGGMSTHEQHLSMINGKQTLNETPPAIRLSGINNKYRARWWGPWVGIDFSWTATWEFSFTGSLEYHRAQYRGRGLWESRSDFDGPFYHKSKGEGVIGRLGFLYAFEPDWLFILNLTGQRWEAEKGKDVVFVHTAKGLSMSSSTFLRKVQWWSLAAALGIEYKY